MIQELLGAVVEERKLNNVPTSSSSSSPPPQSATASSPSSAASSENLRCPRCDSSNTKFCYYNNYNLTQPRHFCKTCRRYWTKGGALRNVPIGGGCRKTKAAATASVIGTKPARPIGRSCSGGGGVHDGHNSCIVDHDVFVPSSPLLWASCSIPHSSHLLALLRATSLQAQQQQQHHHHRSPHHNLLNYCVKEEELGDAVGAPMSMMSLDHPMSNINLCNNNNNNNNNSSLMQQYQQQSQNLFLADTPTSSGIQELYQRLLAPANCGGNDVNQQHVMIGNNNNGTNNVGHVLGSSAAAMATATAAAAASFVMEPIPLMPGPGEFGYWNPAGLSWADHLSTANGAFP